MNDSLSEFWRNTWSAWQSGVLSSINSRLAQVAAGEYEDFANKSTSFKNPLISTFFINHPPLPGEFLINYEQLENRLLMVMISKRLWIYDKNTDEYEYLNFSDVTQIKSSSRWNSHNITVRFKDNQEQKFRNLGWTRSDYTFTRAIELANNNDQQREPTTEIQPVMINPTPSTHSSLNTKMYSGGSMSKALSGMGFMIGMLLMFILVPVSKNLIINVILGAIIGAFGSGLGFWIGDLIDNRLINQNMQEKMGFFSWASSGGFYFGTVPGSTVGSLGIGSITPLSTFFPYSSRNLLPSLCVMLGM